MTGVINQIFLDSISVFYDHKTMHPFTSSTLFSTTAVAATLCLSSPVFAADEVCGVCDKKVMISGGYQHGMSDTFFIANAHGNEAAVRAQIKNNVRVSRC